MADVVERLPFKLARPNPNTGVTDASEIDFGDEALDASIEGRDTTVNSNSGSIEGKVNALIDCLTTIIQNVVFYAGVPYSIPQQLLTQLQLLRIGGSFTVTCGMANCGEVLCGQNV